MDHRQQSTQDERRSILASVSDDIKEMLEKLKRELEKQEKSPHKQVVAHNR